MNHPILIWTAGAVAALAAAPLLNGLINKIKAFFAGRRGPRLFQLYYDLARLLRKESIHSTTSSGLLQLAPSVSLAATLGALLFMPFGMQISPFAFAGDVLLFLYLLGLARMMIVLGALDTGSSFEGMGASREMQFSALAEGVLLALVGYLVFLTKNYSLSGLLNGCDSATWLRDGTSMLLAAAAFFVVLLVENSRVPFDDPETHLELTMIHEAMILDYSGPDLAMILYGAALKLWLLTSFFVMLLLPFEPLGGWVNLAGTILAVFCTAIAIGAVESIMARYRLLKVPQMLVGALGMVLIAIMLIVVFEGGAK